MPGGGAGGELTPDPHFSPNATLILSPFDSSIMTEMTSELTYEQACYEKVRNQPPADPRSMALMPRGPPPACCRCGHKKEDHCGDAEWDDMRTHCTKFHPLACCETRENRCRCDAWMDDCGCGGWEKDNENHWYPEDVDED